MGRNKISGVDIEDKSVKEKIYARYLEAFKTGVYNYIKEDYDPVSREVVPRKYFSGGMSFFGGQLPRALDVQKVSSPVIKGATNSTAVGELMTVPAVLDPVKNLDRLRRILNVLAQSDQVPQVPQGASEDVILEFVLNHLQAQGLIKEVRDDSTDVKIFVIKDEVKESELGRAVQRWVMQPRGGVRAINFKGTDGIWKIVGFESDLDQQLDLELAEVAQRKQGKHWMEAYNIARQETRGGDHQINQEGAQQRFEVARRDILSASSNRNIKNREAAMAQINKFYEAIRQNKHQQGAVLDLRELHSNTDVILVGDLHARLDNLKKILNENNNLSKIQKGEAILVILGDAVHDEQELTEMGSSVEIMQFIMDLKIQNPDSVYYVLGNHDFLSTNFSKGGGAARDCL